MGFIHQLYHNQFEIDNRTALRGGPYFRMSAELDGIEKSLLEALPEKSREIFRQYVEQSTNLSGIWGAEEFILGFRFGAGMMLDVISNESENFVVRKEK